MQKKRVAVVGGGLSGLTAIKQLCDEGHDVMCFEQGADFGGVFAEGGCYESTMLTVSNYFMAFSDFVPSDERLRFWTRREYREYLGRYVQAFGLLKRIHFNSKVEQVERRGSEWYVRVQRGGETREHVFDAVAVTSGMFQFANTPALPGLDTFKGQVHHSSAYTTAHPFEGKHVMCVGMGESSADVTTEISEVAASCVLSLRRYPAVAPRYIPFQEDRYFTIDASWITSRIVNYLPSWMHSLLARGIFKRYLQSINPDVRLRGQWNTNAGPPPRQVITKNERVFTHIVDGKVTPNLSGIKTMTPTGVEFNDGERAELDAVMFCTGFQTRFPFLDLAFTSTRDLYKQMFHPDADESLAFIGFARPQQGGIPAIAEMQSRYFALLCSGKKSLPSREERLAVTAREKAYWQREYDLTPNVSSLVNYCHYIDAIAELVGCKPQIPSLLEDPTMHVKMWCGPQFAAQYRIDGPHPNREASRAFIRSFPQVAPAWQVGVLVLMRLLSDHVLGSLPRFKVRRLRDA